MPLSLATHPEMVFSMFEGCCELVVAFCHTWFAAGSKSDETSSAPLHLAAEVLALVGEACWDREVGIDVDLALVTGPLLPGWLGGLPREMSIFGIRTASSSLLGVGYFGTSI